MSNTRELEKKLKAAAVRVDDALVLPLPKAKFEPEVEWLFGSLAAAAPALRDPAKEPAKFDGDKVRLELIPPEFLQATARGLTYGAKKYAAGNWAAGKGLDHSRLYGAMLRHLNAYWSGEDIDAESGNCHLDHAACMLAFLIAGRERGHGVDDRITIGAAKK